MRALNRKLIADMAHSKAQIFAIAVLIALGVGASIAMASAAKSLAVAEATFYRESRFADVFALVRRAPLTIRDRAAAIAGVAEVDTSILTDVRIEDEGASEPMNGRLVSLPPTGERRLSRLVLRKGRLPIPGHAAEAVVNEAFFVARRLELEHRFNAIINGKRQVLTVVGVALSPEYIYDIRPGQLEVDNRRDGVFWVEESVLAAALDLQGAFNQLTLRLATNASASAVVDELDRLLGPYGGSGAYDRTRHSSARYLDDEKQQLQTQARLVPIVFLGVSGYMLSFLLSRLVAMQRQQIGTLKAIGYGNLQVGLHFIELVIVIAILGVVLGALIGWPIGYLFTSLYFSTFYFPSTTHLFDWSLLVFVGLLSLVVAMIGTAAAVRRAVQLRPAEAMRAEAPQSFKATLVDSVLIMRFLSNAGRMVMRQLTRRPVRALLAAVGIAGAIAVIVTGGFLVDAVQQIKTIKFRFSERYDLAVALRDPATSVAADELGRLPGVLEVEPYRQLAVSIQSGQHHREVGLLGVVPNAELLRIVDTQGRVQAMPASGVLLSARLAQVLDVRVGDGVDIQSLEFSRKRARFVVTATVDDVTGISGYADMKLVQDLAGDGPLLSGAYLAVDPNRVSSLFSRLHELPQVAGFSSKAAELEAFRAMTERSLAYFAGVIYMFGMLMAAAVVYNAARASFADRERELTMLRVLGYTKGQVSLVAVGDNVIHVLIAIPLGCVFGRGATALLARALETDVLRLPAVLSPSTYIFACGTTAISAFFVAIVVARRTGHLDLLAALKSKD